VDVDRSGEDADLERADHDARFARLRDSMRRLELIGGQLAEDALAKAAQALEAAADQMHDDSPVSGPARRADLHAAMGGVGVPAIEHVEFVNDRQTGRVVFPLVSMEGNRWADAGTVSLVFEMFLSGLANREGPVHRWASLSVDIKSLVPRNHELTLIAWIVQRDGAEQHLSASMSKGTQRLAEARGHLVRL
jgi:hypothetical protein